MPNSGQQAAAGRKLLARLVAGAFAATLITVVLAYWWSRGHKEKPPSVPEKLPSNIHQQVSGYTFTRSDEGRRVFTLHAARTVAFKQGGTTVLEDVFVEFFGRAGNRHDILRTSRGEYNPQSGDFYSAGKVQIELNTGAQGPTGTGDRGAPPVLLETSQVHFEHPSLVVTKEPVRFRIGSAWGSARGLAYSVRDGSLDLKTDVTAALLLKGQARQPLRLVASRARYDKGQSQITLWGPLEITQGKRRVLAKQALLSLDERGRLARAALERGVQGFDSSEETLLEFRALRAEATFDPATSQPRNVVAEGDVVEESRRGGKVTRLEAQRFEMNLAGKRPEPKTATASEKAQLTLEPAAEPKGGSDPVALSGDRKILTAAQMRFNFRPGGHDLQDGETVGESKLVLVPLDGKAGRRTITAGQFLMGFDGGSRLESVRGRARTRIVFEPAPAAPPGSLPQETSSELLEANFDPGDGALKAVEQTGDFHFREGDRQASSDEARYAFPGQILTLTGRPQLWDATTRVKADRILFDLRADKAEGVGKVQSTQSPMASQPLGSPSGQSVAARGDAINILADRMVAVQHDQFIHYEGHVRAWHGQDVIDSASLDVYKAQRRVSSGSRVLTSHLQPALRETAPIDPASSLPPREPRPVTIRADHLEYFDEERKASYRGNVQLQAENTTLQATDLDVFFSESSAREGQEIERAVANGHVVVTQPRRRATGEHADYDAAPGKIVLTGGPPTVYDAQKGFTTGQRLTFYIRDDRLVVDGGNTSPTLTKHSVAQ